MSGIEVIGIILGVAPLLISALEGYQKLGKKRDAFRRKSLYIDKMVRALKWQHRLLQSEVKIILRNAQIGDTLVSQMVDYGQYTNLLANPEFGNALQDYLGDNYTMYIEILEDCERELFKVAKAIKGLDQGSWVATGTLSTMVQANQNVVVPGSDFWKRVKFSLHKEDLEKSVDQIDALSKMLERVREKGQQEQQVTINSSSSHARAIASMLRKVQTRASKLHSVLAKSWSRSCQGKHVAHLYLDHRIVTVENGQRSFQQSASWKFDVALRSCSNPQHRMCIIDCTTSDDVTTSRQRKSGRPSFQLPAFSGQGPTRSDVDDICCLLNHRSSQREIFIFYLVEDEKFVYERSEPDIHARRIHHEHHRDLVSLYNLLQDPEHQKKLLLKMRIMLAVVLASSALQLHGTPWCRKLCSRSLLFAQDHGGQLDLHNPFVACSPVVPLSTQSTTKASGESDLLELGILILELWHNQAIEAFAHDSSIDLEETYECRHRIARKWIAEKKDTMLTSIYDAAQRCVNCHFDSVDVDLTNSKVNISIFEGVIKPLWENCKT